MIKLISSGLGKGTIRIGYSVMKIKISLSVPTWDGRKIMESHWNGNSSAFLTKYGYWARYSICLLVYLSIKINIFFIEIVRVYYLYRGETR